MVGRVAGALVAGIATLLVIVPAAGAAVSCTTSGKTLSVNNDTDLHLAGLIRQGDEILVLGGNALRGEPTAVSCTGRTPTVTGIDRIEFEETPNVDEGGFEIDLAGGPLAPGATPESDGTSEIEIEAHLDGDDGYVSVQGSLGPDSLDAETREGATTMNLNRGQEAQPDVDVTMRDLEYVTLAGRKGDDELVHHSEGGEDGFFDLLSSEIVVMSGGKGADAMFGGDGSDVFAGGAGPDSLRTSGGLDIVAPGRGHDRVIAGRGTDLIFSRDKATDIVGCGGGRDAVLADRRDHLRSCEKRRRKGGRGFGIGFLLRDRARSPLPN